MVLRYDTITSTGPVDPDNDVEVWQPTPAGPGSGLLPTNRQLEECLESGVLEKRPRARELAPWDPHNNNLQAHVRANGLTRSSFAATNSRRYAVLSTAVATVVRPRQAAHLHAHFASNLHMWSVLSLDQLDTPRAGQDGRLRSGLLLTDIRLTD